MLRLGIDPEKLYWATFNARTAYVVAIGPSFLFDSFVKIWATCEIFLSKWFTAPLAKNLPYAYERSYNKYHSQLTQCLIQYSACYLDDKASSQCLDIGWKNCILYLKWTVSQYSQNYSNCSFATPYKSLWVQQHSLSLGEGGFPWILLVRFSQTNVFKSNTKTLNRKKMTWNIDINCHLNYLSCQGGHKSLCEVYILQNKNCIQGVHYRHWRLENSLFTMQNSPANVQ